MEVILRNVILFLILIVGLSSGETAMASPESLTYQGRILKSDGTALEYGNVSFIFKILDPSGLCIIYQEQVNGIDMTNSNGVFDVSIGTGSVSYPTSGSLGILDTFNNSSSFVCSGGSPYNPSVSDGRKLRVQFHDGIGWKTISPDVQIRSVPFAAYSNSSAKLGTHPVTDFVLKTGLPTCGPGTFLSYDGTALTCVAPTGGSTGTVTSVSSANAYLTVSSPSTTPSLTLNVGTVAGTVAAGDDSRFTNSRTPTGSAGGDLAGTYPSPTIATNAVTTTKINDGAVTTAKITDASITTAKLFTNPGVNRIVATNSSDGSTLAALVCTAGQLLTWNASTGWTCTDASTLATATPSSFSGSLAGDVTGTQGATVVSSVGGVTAVNVAAGATLANNAVSTATNSTIVKRDASGGFSANAITGTAISASTVLLRDSSTHTITLAAPSTSATYALTFPANLTGANGKTLVSDASGNLTWTAMSTGTVTSVTGTAPIVVATGTTTPAISITQATTTTDGYLSSANWNTFNNKLGTTLTAAKLWVGNASNVATEVAPSGDVTMTNAGAFSLAKISGTTLTVSSLSSGQVLKYNGTIWANAALSTADLSDASGLIKASQMPANCAAGQTLTFSSPSGAWVCSNIVVTASNFGTQNANTILAGPSSGGAAMPTFRGLASADVNTFAYVNGGNSYGAIANIGTADAYGLNIKTSGTARITVESAGNVGVAQGTPRGALDVGGTILGKAATSNGTSTIDFGTGNLQYTTSDCGTFNLRNMKDGGSYMFAVQGTNSATCAFNAYSDAGVTALTVHLPPDHAASTAGKHTIYNFAVMGTHVYVAWTPGY